MSTTGTTAATQAELFRSNADVRSAMRTIVEQLQQAQVKLTGEQPPRDELHATLESTLEHFATLKGRGAALPYIGSGLGNGPLVELTDGSVKWDMIGGIGVHMFGHSDPDLVATALDAALGDTVMQGNLQFNQDVIDFTTMLMEQASIDSRLAHCFLTNSGAVANETALKVVFQKNSPAQRILLFEDCFCGRTYSMAQLGDSAAGRDGLPLNMLADYIPFYDPDRPEESTKAAIDALETLLRRYPKQFAAFKLELVQGEGGFRIAPREFMVELMTRCRDAGLAIWVDEVQTFGRTERMFHFQQMGVGEFVDIVTIGKMSQTCACLYTADYNPRPGLLSGTFIASTAALRVGRRILERLRDGDYYGADGRIAALQKAFRLHANALVERRPECFPPIPHEDGGSRDALGFAGGVGGMMRLTPFGGAKEKIIKLVRTLFDEGVVAYYCGHGPYHLRFLAPIGVLEESQFEAIFACMERALVRVAGDD
jgi:4-aminobutyrate aminotransferase-like enzyme